MSGILEPLAMKIFVAWLDVVGGEGDIACLRADEASVCGSAALPDKLVRDVAIGFWGEQGEHFGS
jgi:hypothetical protein